MKINELYLPNETITVNSYLRKCGVKDIEKFITVDNIEENTQPNPAMMGM